MVLYLGFLAGLGKIEVYGSSSVQQSRKQSLSAYCLGTYIVVHALVEWEVIDVSLVSWLSATLHCGQNGYYKSFWTVSDPLDNFDYVYFQYYIYDNVGGGEG